MKLYIAFEKETKQEFLLYNKVFQQDDIYFSNPIAQSMRSQIGSFLIIFLNTNFENVDECADFISNYCFENYLELNYPELPISFKFIRYAFKTNNYKKVLSHIIEEEQDQLIYAKEIFLKNLNLPYNEDIAGKIGEYYDETEEESDDEPSYENYDNYMYRGRTMKEIDEEINQRMKDYNKYLDLIIERAEKRKAELKENNPKEYKRLLQEDEENSKVYDNGYTEINTLIEDLNIDHVLMAYPYCNFNIYSHIVPYAFYSDHVISILCIEFREFVSYLKNVIRKCQNCGKYFIPENLKSTKYCNNVFENGKTCREIGKEKSYKKNLKGNELLELYRKRYMSLASSNSHYHTEKAEMRFEKYKSEGAIMKEKYIDGKISNADFKRWIESSYN